MSELPRELPVAPTGYTRKLSMHLNFGGGHGAATYEVFDPAGEKMPFWFQYDSDRKKRRYERGFVLPGLDVYLTWAELREMWPAYLERELLRQLDEE
jgi:hypothetical protein